MKNKLASSLIFALTLGVIGYSVSLHPPGGASWTLFAEESAPWFHKLAFLAQVYLWPTLLSFSAIVLFQMQFRLSASGFRKRVLFSVCTVASGVMVLGLRSVASSPSAGPSYVAGMALGYTLMSRLYAIRMRLLFGRIRVPWPVWLGNLRAVQEIDERSRARMGIPPTPASRNIAGDRYQSAPSQAVQ